MKSPRLKNRVLFKILRSILIFMNTIGAIEAFKFAVRYAFFWDNLVFYFCCVNFLTHVFVVSQSVYIFPNLDDDLLACPRFRVKFGQSLATSIDRIKLFGQSNLLLICALC